MAIEYAFVIANDDQVGSAALVGKLIYEATSIYHSFMVFDGARQLHEANLMELVRECSDIDRPRCVVIAVLSPFEETPFPDEVATSDELGFSSEGAFLLGYLQGRLPKSHVFVIRDSSTSDFWIDPEISEISPRGRDWRASLLDALSTVGVDVDRHRIADLGN